MLRGVAVFRIKISAGGKKQLSALFRRAIIQKTGSYPVISKEREMMKRIKPAILCMAAVLLMFLPMLAGCLPGWENSVIASDGVASAATRYYTLEVGDTKYLYTDSDEAVISAFWTSSDPSCVEILSQDSVCCQIKVTDYTSSRVLIHCEYYYQDLVGSYIYTFTGYTDYYITIEDTRVVVSLNANGGRVSPSYVTLMPDDTYASLPDPTRTGYEFQWWYTADDRPAYPYKKLYYSYDHTLYADWSANNYYINFMGNGADSGSMSYINCYYDSTYTLPANAFTREGYTFSGWSTKADASGTIYSDGASVRNLTSTDGADIYLYAVWATTSNDISLYRTTLSSTSYTYSGAEKKPTVTVKNGAKALTKDTDYTVTYTNNINAGTATVTVRGIGQYTGTVERTFTINKAAATASISAKEFMVGKTAQISLSSTAGATYSGYNSSIVSVSSAGVVKGLAVGSTTITININEDANYKATTLSLSVTVLPKNSGTCGGQLRWYYDPDACELTISGTGIMADYSSDGAPWHAYRNSIKTLTIEEGVTRIGVFAFFGLNQITSVVIPDSVREIGRQAFTCGSLDDITLGSGLERIEQNAFVYSAYQEDSSNFISNCLILDNWILECNTDNSSSISIPSYIEHIADYSLTWVTSISLSSSNTSFVMSGGCLYTADQSVLLWAKKTITSCTIPSGTVRIWPYAFMNCNKLTSISIPDTVRYIGNNAFLCCSALTSVTIPEGVRAIEAHTFDYCIKLKTIVIPSSVQSIGSCAFEDCSALTSVTIPAGVQTIANYTFYKCSSLTSITIPDGVTSIGDYAFRECSRLASVDIPQSVTYIGDGCFRSCSALKTIDLPDGLSFLGSSAFRYCSSLTSIVIPEKITSIHGFASCTSLTSITLPMSLKSINYYAFYNCYNLKTVYFQGNEAQRAAIEIENTSNYNQYVINATWICSGPDVTIDSYEKVAYLPQGLRVIESEAFAGIDAEAIVIPDSCEVIESRAFADCPNLAYVVLALSVTDLADDAFGDSTPIILYQ